ncbi:MAG: rod shape-determining protein [Anaerolineales bacterium]|nr:rod shape-determining protein [Anaerolineales bacterium]
MGLFSKNLGIDLGTVNTRVVMDGVLIIEEPTVVAIDVQSDRSRMVSIGTEALGMYGRVSEDVLQITRPLRNGVVANYKQTVTFLTQLVRRIHGPMSLARPRLMVTYPYGITSVERRAVHEAAYEISSDADLVPQPVAAALGMELPIGTPTGNMVVLLGGGCTQSAVIALHDIVSGDTYRQGGIFLDEAIMTYVRRKYGLVIAQPTAEQVKIKIGAAVLQDEEQSIELQGQDQITGLPKPFTLSTSEVVEAIQPALNRIAESIRLTLEGTPPELASDIIDRGIALCGGVSLLRGIDRYLTQKLSVPTYVVDNPLTCVVEGAEKAIALYPMLKRNIPLD